MAIGEARRGLVHDAILFVHPQARSGTGGVTKVRPFPEENHRFERVVVTVLSCGIVIPAVSEPVVPLPDAFVAQAVTILQVMGGCVVHTGAANVIMAEFASREMSETDAERAVLAAFRLL